MKTLTTKTTGTQSKRLLRFIAAFILGISGAVVAGVAMATPATAACSGSLGFREATSTGELVVYYSTASGGTNCAQMNHLGTTYGVTSYTGVFIVKCTQTSPGLLCTYSGPSDDDYDNYAYYAGPVKVTSTNGKCILALGDHGSYSYGTAGTAMCG